MGRSPQPSGARGSLKWIQIAVNDRRSYFDKLILTSLDGATSISWRSPLRDDDFSEYRDSAFLELLGLQELKPALKNFWPQQGPQWDALAVSNTDQILLVEAKAHLSELLSSPCGAGPASMRRIESCFETVQRHLRADPRAPWTTAFYQLANRVAHLWFLREHGFDAKLLLVNFVGDDEMKGPRTSAEWEAAFLVAEHALGLSPSRRLNKHILKVYPDVRRLV